MKDKHTRKNAVHGSHQDSQEKNQGEGDRESSRHYNEATLEFIAAGKVDKAAKEAAGQDPQEAERSERAGKQRAKEEDPEIHRNYHKPER